MSTHDVPGHGTAKADVLAAGCWAEHDDGSLILVMGTEDGTVVYSVFDVDVDPPLEYRDAMPEAGFKTMFSWQDSDPDSQWTWHNRTVFPWSRVMSDFPAGPRDASAVATLNAATRLAERLNLRAQTVAYEVPEQGRTSSRTLGERIRAAIEQLKY